MQHEIKDLTENDPWISGLLFKMYTKSVSSV